LAFEDQGVATDGDHGSTLHQHPPSGSDPGRRGRTTPGRGDGRGRDSAPSDAATTLLYAIVAPL